jgi:hypothetical protein
MNSIRKNVAPAAQTASWARTCGKSQKVGLYNETHKTSGIEAVEVFFSTLIKTMSSCV